MIESIKNRRTIRKYSDKPVTKELVYSLLEVASRAATMGNMQLYSVVVTESDEMKEVLSPIHFNQPMVKSAPLVLTFCADFNRFTKWCKERNANPGYDNFLSFMNAVSDTLLFVQNFCTLAEDEGLGTCYLGTTVYNATQIIDALKLPKLTFPIATITIGYPSEVPTQPDRMLVSSFVHNEFYCDYDSDMINAIYEAKESLDENKHFVCINNKENLAQVFTDFRYTKDANEAISDVLLDVLKRQQFL
jgi:nitroreductase